MKKLYIFFTMLLVLTACSSENNTIDNEGPEVEPVVEVKGIQVELTDPVIQGDEGITRSTLIYDDTSKKMAFKWGDTDCIGVFTYTEAEHSQQKKFSQIDDPENTDHLRAFETDDHKLKVDKQFLYVSCFPYIEGHTLNYTKIPVDYTGQKQKAAVEFCDYWKSEKPLYKASQPLASAHLPAYDFQCTGITDPTPTGGIHFKMNRMGAIVRFWIQISSTNNYVYDELQLVNRSKQFTTKATMDAEKCTLTATGQSHVVNLKLGENGFDLSEPETSNYYWHGTTTHTGYLMLYMMMAPIDLTGSDVENCFIYLVAHEKDHPKKKKHYFKSPGLSKPNLTPNAFYQWTVYPDEDTPIEMENITVEEWRAGTSFDNGDGSGTETW